MKEKKKAVIIAIVIVLLLLASIASIILMKDSGFENGTVAYIYKNNEIYKVIDLSLVDESYRITIGDEKEGINVIEVRKGSIGVVEASCPDKTCINMGFISDSVLPIACLPNHVTIKVEKVKGEDNTIDGIAY